MKYVVEIEETLVKYVVVEEESINDAMSIVNDAYNNEKVVLDYNDYCDTEFNYIREANEDDDYQTIQN